MACNLLARRRRECSRLLVAAALMSYPILPGLSTGHGLTQQHCRPPGQNAHIGSRSPPALPRKSLPRDSSLLRARLCQRSTLLVLGPCPRPGPLASETPPSLFASASSCLPHLRNSFLPRGPPCPYLFNGSPSSQTERSLRHCLALWARLMSPAASVLAGHHYPLLPSCASPHSEHVLMQLTPLFPLFHPSSPAARGLRHLCMEPAASAVLPHRPSRRHIALSANSLGAVFTDHPRRIQISTTTPTRVFSQPPLPPSTTPPPPPHPPRAFSLVDPRPPPPP